jgi:ketosteroid isomerase-like protein
MSQENVDIVREAMALADEARNADLSQPALDALMVQFSNFVATDAQFDMSARVFNPDVYTGKAGLSRLLREIREVWNEFRVTPERFVDAGDRVVVIEAIRGRGRSSNVPVESRSASIWTLRDGQIIHMKTSYDPREALEAVGLEG